jgi:hypothetical protein
MRYIIKVTASALLPLLIGGHAQTAEDNEPTVITLSCDGALTRKSDTNKPMDMQELQKTLMVVNRDDHTVFFLGYVVPLSNFDQVNIDFGGTQLLDYGFSMSISGHIDRASGRMDVTTVTLDPTKSDDPRIATLRYDLACEAK